MTRPVLLLVLGLAACRSTPAEPPAPLRIEVSGCADVRRSGECLLPSSGGRLCLWADVPAGEEVQVEGGARVACGASCCFAVSGGASRLTVTAAGPRPRQAIVALGPVAPCPAADTARALRGEGRTEEALAGLDGPMGSDACAAEVAGLRARLLLDEGETEEGIGAFRAALAMRKEAGSVAGFVNDSLALAHTLTYRVRRSAEAREVIAAAAQAAGPYHEGIARVPYYEGRLLLELGDLRGALDRLREADLRAGRLGLATLRGHAREAMAEALQVLGRPSEAAALLDTLATGDRPDRDRAMALNNIGWLRLLQAEAEGRGADPLPPLREAARLAAACGDAGLLANVLLNQALAALQRGDVVGAAALAARARSTQPAPDDYVAEWMLDVDGRVALRSGRAEEALGHFEALAGRAGGSSNGRWRAELGRGRSLQALGRAVEAAAAYERAEGLLDELALLVPLGEGRTTFLGGHDLGARLLVDLLVELEQPEQALRAARRSASRLVAAVQRIDRLTHLGAAGRAAFERDLDVYRRARAELDALRRSAREATQEELVSLRAREATLEAEARSTLDRAFATAGVRAREERPPAEGEVLLVFHPAGDGLVGLAAGAETKAVRLSVMPGDGPVALSRKLLEPLRAQIAGARRLRIIAAGPLREVDFHALPWDGGVLGEHVPVAYAVDTGAPATRGGFGALVVADPSGNLRSARKEGDTVATALRALGPVRVLAGSAATRGAMVEGLPGAALLHYAGHAEAEGRDGFGSALVLAGEDRLTVGDVLALPAVPQVVVLAACRSGRDDAAGRIQSLGLAQAFVAAGAGAVIAATRPVDDACGALLTASLYEHPLTPGSAPDRLAEAQAALRTAAPHCDGASFRALMP